MKFCFLFNILCLFVLSAYATTTSIKVLFTAAIIEDNYAQRKADYIRNLQLLKKYGCDVYVVESCQQGPTFLDEFCDHVCYTKSNNPLESKSYNEVKSMLIGMQHFNFEPEDMIVKVTGRYVLEDSRFILHVKNNLHADVIARVWNEIDAYTGYFAIKRRCFDELIEQYYQAYNAGEKLYAIEWALGHYLNTEKNRLNLVPISSLYGYPNGPGRS